MVMNPLVLSRQMIENCYSAITHNCVVISIRGYSDQPANIHVTQYVREIKFVQFDDITEPILDDPKYKDLILFNKNIAKEIVNFVLETNKDKYPIICNCEGGISRSAAVAAAIAKHYNGKDGIYFRRYLPNMLVYKILLKTFMME